MFVSRCIRNVAILGRFSRLSECGSSESSPHGNQCRILWCKARILVDQLERAPGKIPTQGPRTTEVGGCQLAA